MTKEAFDKFEAELDERMEKRKQEVKEIQEKANMNYYMYYTNTFHAEPKGAEFSGIRNKLDGEKKRAVIENLNGGTVVAEVLDSDDNVIATEKIPMIEEIIPDKVVDNDPKNETKPHAVIGPSNIKINTPEHARFYYKGMYSEEMFLKGILDNIIALSPKHTYELMTIEGSKYYKLVMKSTETGSVTAQFDIDPRFNYGLGIPLIKVPITNGAGTNIFDWVPLGMGIQLCNTLFSNSPMVSLGNIPVNDMVIAVHVIKAERELWPDKSLYDFVDMSNTLIRSGKEYHDFGYHLYQIRENLKAMGITGFRFRPEYIGYKNFKLISDGSVNYPDGMEESKCDIQVIFNGSSIVIESLYDNSKHQAVQLKEFIYPDRNSIVPPVYGETENDIIRFADTCLVPKMISGAEKATMGTVIQKPQSSEEKLSPNDNVDVLREMSNLISDGHACIKKFIDGVPKAEPNITTA